MLHAENIDHLSPKWTGKAWTTNSLELPNLLYQRALFPLVSHGGGTVLLPTDETFVLRVALLTTNRQAEEEVLRLWGRIQGQQESVLATLRLSHGKYTWHCPVSNKADCLFDAAADVELNTGQVTTGVWGIYDTVANPLPYQQMFGWNSPQPAPTNPAKSRVGGLSLARQLTSAGWHLTRVEIPPLTTVWIGELALLPFETPAAQSNFNVVRHP